MLNDTTLIGTGATCWIDGKTLNIKFGLNPTITIANTITLNNGSVNSVGCNGAVFKPIKINNANKPLKPDFTVAYTA